VIRSTFFPVPVFAFHGIVNINNPQALSSRAAKYDYSIQKLEEFLRYLIKHNYWFLSTQELYDYFIIKSRPIPSNYAQKKPILLSFDDGYKSLDTVLLPILNKLQREFNYPLKIVLFINSLQMQKMQSGDFSNKSNKVNYLSCEDLRKGLQQGFYDIQSHGFSHRDLTKINEKELEFELVQSQKILQQCTQNIESNQLVASHFAYPYNRANEKVLKLVAKFYLSGYGANNYIKQILISNDLFRIPRLIVTDKDSPNKLILLVKIISAI